MHMLGPIHLQKSMTANFMDRMEKACSPPFYGRFKFTLKNLIKKEVDNDFTCTWAEVESAMYSAVGEENKVQKLHGFNKIKASNFYGKSLELVITDVDEKVDAVWGNSQVVHKDSRGRMISAYSYSTIHKYTIILGITEHLGAEFNQVKDYIEQEISSMLENLNTLLDIQEFQEKLVTEFETRNVIKIFRTKNIPQQRKPANVNTGEVTEKKEDSDPANTVKDEFKKLKKRQDKD